MPPRFRRFSHAPGWIVRLYPDAPPLSLPSFPRARWRLPLLWLLAVVALAAGIGMRLPQPPDEPRFVLAARAMVDSGQWLVPHRGSEFYAEKPPVYMWMQAAAHQLLDWKGSFLLPSLLAALLSLWLVADLARRLWSPRLAPYAMAALFCSLQFGLMAKRAQIDMVLVAMTTASLWGLLRHLCERPNLPALWLAGIAAGVGTVTKGVGFLPLLIVLPWLAWRLQYRRRHCRDAPGPAPATLAWLIPAFLLGTAVWLAPLGWALLRHPDPALQAYAHELLFKQTATRYAHAWHHLQPAWYYLQVMLTLWLPGSLLLPWLARPWWRRLRRTDARFWLLLGWAGLVLLFFTISAGKREVYVLPMLPALALASAPLLPGLLRRMSVRRYLLGYSIALGLLSFTVGALLLHGAPWALAQLERRAMPIGLLPVLGGSLLGLGAAVLGMCAWLRQRRAALLVLLTHSLLWCVYGVLLLPAVDPYASAYDLMQRAGERIGPQAELGLLAWREQNLLQADRPAREFGFKRPWDLQWRDAGRWLAAAPHARWLLVLDTAMSPCVDTTQVIDIGMSNRNRWQLVPGTAWSSDCRAAMNGASNAEE